MRQAAAVAHLLSPSLLKASLVISFPFPCPLTPDLLLPVHQQLTGVCPRPWSDCCSHPCIPVMGLHYPPYIICIPPFCLPLPRFLPPPLPSSPPFQLLLLHEEMRRWVLPRMDAMDGRKPVKGGGGSGHERGRGRDGGEDELSQTREAQRLLG